MNLQAEKIELAKRLLDTEDVSIVKAIKAIFAGSEHSSAEWGDLPDQVIDDVKESFKQVDAGMGIPHEKVRETYKKWL